jgi:hypothetical protein
MKNYIPYLIILILGIVIGWLCRGNHFRGEVEKVQRDTIVRYDTVKILRQEMVTKPVVKKEVEYVYIEKVDTIYRDSIRYVVLPREYYYTKAKNVEIWHSGIDSTIDSLNVVQENVKITDTYIPKSVKNMIRVGIEADYIERVHIPIYFQYSRMLHKNVEIYGKFGYDLPSQLWGVGAGINVQIGW